MQPCVSLKELTVCLYFSFLFYKTKIIIVLNGIDGVVVRVKCASCKVLK